MNYKSIGIGLALTCGAMALGGTLTPAQAAVVGTANFSGLLSFANEFQTNPATETIQFTNPGTILSADGIFTGSTNVTIGSGNPYDLVLNRTGIINANSATYQVASITNPILTFSNGIEFQATGVENIVRSTTQNTPLGVTTALNAFSIVGNFYNGVNAIGLGSITAQEINNPGGTTAGSYSFSIQAESVPEPFTILGSITALGMGAALKKKQAEKQIKEKVTA